MGERVAARAERAFLEHEVFATRDRTGILVFLSIFERRVVVQSTAGIDHAVDGERFEAQFVEKIHERFGRMGVSSRQRGVGDGVQAAAVKRPNPTHDQASIDAVLAHSRGLADRAGAPGAEKTMQNRETNSLFDPEVVLPDQMFPGSKLPAFVQSEGRLMLAILQDASFKADIEKLGGYDVSQTGNVIARL